MRFVEFVSNAGGGPLYINPGRVDAIGLDSDGSTFIRVGNAVYNVGGSTASVAAEIERRLADGKAGDLRRKRFFEQMNAGFAALREDPDASQPPPPEDPVALLAAGKRLRYLRDAGAMGERVPAEVDVFLKEFGENEHGSPFIYGFFVNPGGDETTPLFQSEWSRVTSLAARRTTKLLFDLGYRFDREIG